MRRPFMVFLAIVLLAGGIWMLTRLLASEETRVRWALEDMCEAFNDEKSGSVAAGFAEEFEVRRWDVTREEVHTWLAQSYIRTMNKGGFPWTAEILDDSWEITVEEAGEELFADVVLRFRFLERQETGTVALSPLRGELRLQKIEGEWLIIEADADEDQFPF